MLIYNTPKDDSYYIKVTEDGLVYYLHSNGFYPIYRDNNYIYFRRTQELENFLSLEINEDRRENICE